MSIAPSDSKQASSIFSPLENPCSLNSFLNAVILGQSFSEALFIELLIANTINLELV